jgi:hypothetical protein
LAVELPSLADALILVVLIVPGFITVKVFAWIAAYDRKLSEFDMTVLSFIASLIVYLPFSLITSLDSIDKIRAAVLMPQTVATLLSLSVVIGLFPGWVMKRLFRARYFYGPVWDSIASQLPEKDTFVLVHTVLGQEIMGNLHSIGTGGSPKDVRLVQPEMIIRDKSYNAIKKIRLGREMFVSEKDVESIAFL